MTKELDRQEDQTVEEASIPTVEVTPIKSNETHKFYGGTSPVIQAYIQDVEQYVRHMSPGNIVTNEQGAMWQNRLYHAMLNIIRTPNIGDMVAGMDSLLAIFKREQRGALNETYLQRFNDVWMVEPEVIDSYGNLCVIFANYCTPENREKFGRRIMLDGEYGLLRYLGADDRQRLIQYLRRYVDM